MSSPAHGVCLRIESGLKKMGVDHNILNYVKIAYINKFVGETLSSEYKCFMKDNSWKHVLDNMKFASYDSCICGKKSLVHLNAIVHKNHIHNIKEENVLIIGSDCIKRVIYYADSINMAHAFGDINCSTLFTNKCGIRSSTGLRAIKSEYADYYSSSTLWNYTHVCHNCSTIFKKILMDCKPGSEEKSSTIYYHLKTNCGKKRLSDFLNFLKSKNLQNTDKWREWCIVANVCLTC